jgi:virginiamycin B lyase
VSAIARITPQGQIKEFPDIAADHLAAGPDGNVWFFGGPVQNQTGPSPSPTTQPREQLGRITPQGQVTEFDLGGPKFPATGLVALPDGNLWFSIAGSVGRITPQGQVTHFPVGGVPAWGPDGNVWAAGGNAIARITPQGQITRFSNGFADPQRGPSGDVVAGSDGNLWFTEGSPDDPGIPPKPGIGRITPQGQITEYTQGLKPFPLNLVSGPDGNMWFLDNGSIGRITVGRTGNPKVGRATVKGTAARIPISCKGSTGSSCELTATLTVTEKLRGGKVIAVTAASAMPKPKVVVLGTDTVSITAGQRKTVRIAMNAVGRQLLARRRALKVKLAITQPRGGKNRLVYSQKLTFKANRRGK